MRVTSTTTFLTLRDGLGGALSRVQDLQTQLSSGRRINNYSDAPSDAAAALRFTSEESAWQAYGRAANDAQARLGVTDTSLQSGLDILHRVHDLAISATNGAMGPDARSAVSKEVLQLRDQLADVANTQHLGSSVFGGFAAQALTKDPVTGAYTWTGDGGVVSRQVGTGTVLQVNLDGKQIFGFGGAPGSDVFAQLQTLSQDIAAGNDAAVATGATAIATQTTQVNQALGTVGALVNRVERVTTAGQATVQQLQSQRSQLEDVDMADAVLQLSQAQTAYQAALGAAARSNLPSLADYLK